MALRPKHPLKMRKTDGKIDSSRTIAPKPRHRKKRKNETREFEQHVDDMEVNTAQSDEDEGRHTALLQSIQKLDGKKGAIAQRSTNAVHVSEFLSTSTSVEPGIDDKVESDGKVKLDSLLTALSKSTKISTLKKQFNKTNTTTNKLPQPLEKIHQDQLERKTTYKENQLEVHKWQSVIDENRNSEHQHFPLVQTHIRVPNTKESLRSYVPRNEMEIEIQTLLKGPGYDPNDDPELKPQVKLSRNEERKQRAMDVRAAREEHHMMRKHRSMIADVASKNKRQKKIKSRAFHRHLRASRRKEAFNELEKMRHSDPDGFKQKAEEIEKERIEERGTMKHKSNKYGKLAKRYGKFNEKIKESLDEMHSQAAKLMEKKNVNEESDDSNHSDSDDSVVADLNVDDSDNEHPAEAEDNPWMSQKAAKRFCKPKSQSEVYHKPEPVQADPPLSDNADSEVDADNTGSLPLADSKICQVFKPLDSSEDEHEEIIIHRSTEVETITEDAIIESSLKLTTREDVERFDSEFHQHTAEAGHTLNAVSESHIPNSTAPETQRVNNRGPELPNEAVSERSKKKIVQKDMAKEIEDIDLNKVMKAVRSSDLTNKSLLTNDNSDADDDTNTTSNDNKMNIQQAFIDDDVVEEFEQNRDEVYGANKKSVAEFQLLPGWGQWGGEGLKPRKIRWREQQKLKDKELEKSRANRIQKHKHPYAIINHDAINSQPIAKYQPMRVREENAHRNNILKPISREWIAEMEHKTLIKPRLTTTVGAIIDPIDKTQVIEKKDTATLKYNKDIKSAQYKLNNSKKSKHGVKKYDVERIATLF